MANNFRFWILFKGLEDLDLERIFEEKGIEIRYQRSDLTYRRAQYLVGYPDTARVFMSDHIYSHSSLKEDFAYKTFEVFLKDMEKCHADPFYLPNGREQNSSWNPFPYKKSIPGMMKSKHRRNQKDQVDEMLRDVGQAWFDRNITKAEQSPKEKPVMERVKLFTVAAIFYPELPETAVMSKEDVEYPVIVLAPTHVLARTTSEAQGRVAVKVKEGYLDRPDGHVEFMFEEFGRR